MTKSDIHKKISERLFNENICSLPLDEKALSIIEGYMNYSLTASDLMRKLSTIELNYAQIAGDTRDACHNAMSAKDNIAVTLRRLTDDWRTKGLLRDFVFSFSDDECDYIRESFVTVIEYIRYQIGLISKSLLVLGETAAQIRASSACFSEIYRESRLAVYAAMLNRNKDEILDFRAMSLEAHASASECERASGTYLGRARACTRIITDLNSMITEVTDSLRISSDTLVRVNIISPVKAANAISDMISRLEKIKLEIEE